MCIFLYLHFSPTLKMFTKLERLLTCRDSSKVIYLVQCPLFTKNNALLAKNVRYPSYPLKTLTTISTSTTSCASSSSMWLTRTTSPEELNTAIDLLRLTLDLSFPFKPEKLYNVLPLKPPPLRRHIVFLNKSMQWTCVQLPDILSTCALHGYFPWLYPHITAHIIPREATRLWPFWPRFHAARTTFRAGSAIMKDVYIADNSSVFQESWRNVIYLVQAESCISQHIASFLERQPSTERDVMVLSWRKPCIDWTRNLSNVVYIFDNTTTWSSGRNRLYGIALNRSHEYLYYIFLDEDIEFYFTANTPRDIISRGTEDPLTAFENFLRGYEPAIGLCNYCSRCGKLLAALCSSPRTTTGRLPTILPATISFDAAINAFHAKAIRSLLPYRLDYEAISWWESQKYVILASDVLFRGQVTRYTTVTAINNEHRDYPSETAGKLGEYLEICKVLSARNVSKSERFSLGTFSEHGRNSERKRSSDTAVDFDSRTKDSNCSFRSF